MTENEKRLRTWCESASGMARILDEVLREVRSAARAKALEEAAKYAGVRVYDGWHEAKNNHANPREALAQYVTEAVRTLITTPAPASIPAEMVREVLRNIDWDDKSDVALLAAALGVAEEELDVFRLGVPLDAAQEARDPVTHRRSGAQWAACGAKRVGLRLSSNPADVTCEDSRCKVTP